jgi:hypothetical protein
VEYSSSLLFVRIRQYNICLPLKPKKRKIQKMVCRTKAIFRVVFIFAVAAGSCRISCRPTTYTVAGGQLSEETYYLRNRRFYTCIFPDCELSFRDSQAHFFRSPKKRTRQRVHKKSGGTYFRVCCTIIGSNCLTSAFGLGTGVTSLICSPEEMTAAYSLSVTIRTALPNTPSWRLPQAPSSVFRKAILRPRFVL